MAELIAEPQPFGSEVATAFAFARHETFHLRYAWLKKSFDAISRDPLIFAASDAHIQLGVGKNMARAMKYWALAFKILEKAEDSGNVRSAGLRAMEFGQRVFSAAGYDPYLENEATLWLLHWQLLRPISLAPAWYYFFNLFNESQFDASDMMVGLKAYCLRTFPSQPIAESSLRKDINCIIRMYLSDDAKQYTEDSIDSPFLNLGLLRAYDKNRYGFNTGHKPNLPSQIIVACCLDFASTTGANSVSVSELAHAENSPGKVFKIGPSNIESAIEEVSEATAVIEINLRNYWLIFTRYETKQNSQHRSTL